MVKTSTALIFLFSSLIPNFQANEKLDYTFYHKQVIEAEKFISSNNYEDAIKIYEELFEEYDFIFLREYQIASQVALQNNDKQKGLHFLEEGMKSGWDLKSMKRNNFIAKFLNKEDWILIKKKYPALKKLYETKIDPNLRKRVKKMFSKDQWKSIQALFRFSSKAKERYAEKKFAPHSERQIKSTIKILKTHGYPGEKLIGNDYWMSTIISHHNSISTEYLKQDTLYPSIRPKLLFAIGEGQISPFEFAIIDEWYFTVAGKSVYGIINPPLKSEIETTNEMRQKIFVRPIEIRNKLVDIEDKTGMNLYLDIGPWVNGKILAEN